MEKIFALALLMRPLKNPAIHQYWSRDPLSKGSVSNKVIPGNKFQVILGFYILQIILMITQIILIRWDYTRFGLLLILLLANVTLPYGSFIYRKVNFYFCNLYPVIGQVSKLSCLVCENQQVTHKTHLLIQANVRI